MKKALILAMALFVFAGCSTKPGQPEESTEEKFLKRFEGYSTIVYTEAKPISPTITTFTIKEGGRVLETAGVAARIERAESDSVAVYKDPYSSYRISFTSETETKWEDWLSSKWVPVGTAVLKK